MQDAPTPDGSLGDYEEHLTAERRERIEAVASDLTDVGVAMDYSSVWNQ
ncbi:MAG: hypothetical protein V5A62_17295 [Haloarculaceae archaeon]